MQERPLILIAEDQPETLSALLDALTRRFGADYRVVPHLSPKAALADMERRRTQGEQIALVIGAQWMKEMHGLEFLGRSKEIERTAKRALLVSWGDRRSAPAILEGCAFGQLDNYLLKPWSPAEVYLYPAVSEFLAEWTQAFGPKLEIVRVIGDQSHPRTHEVLELLQRNGIPRGFYSRGSEAGHRLLHQTGSEEHAQPVVMLMDGRALSNPSNEELADALGSTRHHTQRCDVAIVGAGPGGLAAAVYAASEGLRTVVVEREAIGGQAGTSSLIRNYLGFPRGISGADLMQRAYQQAWLFGTRYVFARHVTGLRAEGAARILSLSDGSTVLARCVVIATGAHYRRIASLERLLNAGVFYTSMTDTRIVAGRDVVVAGGGNSAGQAVIYLAEHASKVTLLVRGGSLERGMSKYLIDQIRHSPNVEVRLNIEVVEGHGTSALEAITARDPRDGSLQQIPTGMLFVMIGAEPHTEWLSGLVARDRHGFVLTGAEVGSTMPFATTLPGVFAVGDVRSKSIKRLASAVGEGAGVISQVHEYLESPIDVGPPEWSARPSDLRA